MYDCGAGGVIRHAHEVHVSRRVGLVLGAHVLARAAAAGARGRRAGGRGGAGRSPASARQTRTPRTAPSEIRHA